MTVGLTRRMVWNVFLTSKLVKAKEGKSGEKGKGKERKGQGKGAVKLRSFPF